MREIKFRAIKRDVAHEQFPDRFTKTPQGFVYGTGLYYDGVNTWLINENPNKKCFAGIKATLVDPETVGQYTGLRDSKWHIERTEEYSESQEIYEYDVCEARYGNRYIKGVVEYYGGCFVIKNLNDKYANLIILSECEDAEVLGNQFEHPHLLEVSQWKSET